MTQRIILPDKTIETKDARGSHREVNVCLHLASLIVENVPQQSDTEAFLIHSIREKVDATLEANTGHMDLEETEILFLQQGLERLRTKGSITGSGWYYLINALRNPEKEQTQDGHRVETADR